MSTVVLFKTSKPITARRMSVDHTIIHSRIWNKPMGYTWVRFENDNDVLSRVIGDPCWEGLISVDTETSLSYLDMTKDFHNRVCEIRDRYEADWKIKYKVSIQNARGMLDSRETVSYARLRGLMTRPYWYVNHPWVSSEELEAYVAQ